MLCFELCLLRGSSVPADFNLPKNGPPGPNHAANMDQFMGVQIHKRRMGTYPLTDIDRGFKFAEGPNLCDTGLL